jgi:hypothetical protein
MKYETMKYAIHYTPNLINVKKRGLKTLSHFLLKMYVIISLLSINA